MRKGYQKEKMQFNYEVVNCLVALLNPLFPPL